MKKLRLLLSNNKLFIVVCLIIILGYFFLRLYRIDSLPLFTDEAIYVRWSQIARYDAVWRFISLTDGKQPSFVWLTMTVMRFFKDPLLAGRLISVAAGLMTLTGLFFLGKELFKNTSIGIISSLLYLFYPMALVYDRMALYDSLVGTFMIWTLYFEVLLVNRIRLDIAYTLSFIMAGAILTKTSAFFSIALMPFTLLLFDFRQKERLQKLLKWIALATISVIIAYGLYSIQRLSPFFHIINEKNAVFVYSFKDWLNHPFLFFQSNIKGLADWFITYFSWPVFILIFVSFVISKKFLKEKILLFLWFLVPFVYLAFFGKTLYPRFIFFMTLMLLPLAAFTLNNISTFMHNKSLKVLFILIIIGISYFRTDFFILTHFAAAPIPYSDREQYVSSWPAGGGVKETVAFFREEAKNKKIFVATEGTFGLMPYALELYLVDNPNIKIKGFWPIGDVPPGEVLQASRKVPTYFVFYQPCPSCPGTGSAPLGWRVELLNRYQQGTSNYYLSIYRVIPQ